LVDLIKSEHKKNAKPWQENEKNLLRLYYNGYGASIKCSRILAENGYSRTPCACQSQAKIWGLQTNINSGRFKDWTKEEDDFLIENAEKHSKYWLSKKLHRTVNAVIYRRKYLGINGFSKDGWYNLVETAGILGIGYKTTIDLIKNGKLKATERNDGDRRKDFWEITEDSLYQFFTTYPSFLQGRNCDMVQVLAIATKHDFKYKTEAERGRKPNHVRES
jgi:hypothetical protein